MGTYMITQQQLDDIRPEDRRWRWPGVDGPGTYFWNEAANRYERHKPEMIEIEEEHPYDFDRTGLGIGGLGRYIEEPFIPTLQQMERGEQMERRARRCRRCGASDVFDGAMFTTDPGSGLCDDCYG